MNPRRLLPALVAVSLLSLGNCSPAPEPPAAESQPTAYLPGSRVLLDAHNCYPYHGQWANRLDRALAGGLPLAIEQDLAWFNDAVNGKAWSIVAHNEPFTGKEPTLREYFFERVRPLVETALASDDHSDWPLITLNLDFKTQEPEHLDAIWRLLEEYQDWLTTAERLPDPAEAAPLDVKPLLVLTGESDAQQQAFHDNVAAGGKLLVFGAVRVNRPESSGQREQDWKAAVDAPPEVLVPAGARSNYRRWWNNSWFFVEEGGATRAGDWTAEDGQRLRSLVDHAHANNLWIRFYTLNGHDPADESQGWGAGYNFGSRENAEKRWRAAIAAGVDFVATDQYEGFREALGP